MTADFLDAVVATENDNLVHYAQVIAQASDNDNITCRVDKPVFVSQPEIDGRVTVKGEDDAATTVECADLMLEAQEVIDGTLYVQYLRLYGNADIDADWIRVDAADRPVTGSMAHGVGAAAGVLSYVFPANHPSQGRPHRACIDLAWPKDFAPLCQVFVSKTKSTV
ncbi:MAG: hypothetical protein ACRDH9_11150 [Actinomycetota bacterium]